MNLHQLLSKTYETHFQAWRRNHSYVVIAQNVFSQPSKKKKRVIREVQGAVVLFFHFPLPAWFNQTFTFFWVPSLRQKRMLAKIW